MMISLIAQSVWAAAKPKDQYVEIRTDLGTCIVKLYKETPLHQANFVKLMKAKFYNGLLFHRVIENFMIQGGDPDSRNAEKGVMLGAGDPGYTIPSEFRDSLFHKKGALAAARDNNPAKASSGSQFYIVQGKTYTDEELDRLEEGRLEGRRILGSQREAYKTIGGAPFLDQNYTVFGEIVKGIELVDQLANVPTDGMDRPVVDQKMEIKLLKRGEVRRLEKELRRADVNR
jgi:peptidyl-prolyl cis-trans isomerase B (cyclophilin B)